MFKIKKKRMEDEGLVPSLPVESVEFPEEGSDIEETAAAEETAGEDETSEDEMALQDCFETGMDVEASLAAFNDWLEEAVGEEDRRQAARTTMEEVKKSLGGTNLVERLFEVVALASDYDRAVAEAAAEGEERGRAAMAEELANLPPVDDGVPHPGACGGAAIVGRMPSIFDLARNAY